MLEGGSLERGRAEDKGAATQPLAYAQNRAPSLTLGQGLASRVVASLIKRVLSAFVSAEAALLDSPLPRPYPWVSLSGLRRITVKESSKLLIGERGTRNLLPSQELGRRAPSRRLNAVGIPAGTKYLDGHQECPAE